MRFSKVELVEFIRFNIMGVLHVVTFSFVLWLGNICGLSYFLSGALGYIAVLIEGALGNIFYVFRSGTQKGMFWRYFIGNSLVYIVTTVMELLITHMYIPHLEATGGSPILILTIQYSVYVFGGVCVYLLTKLLVFSEKKS